MDHLRAYRVYEGSYPLNLYNKYRDTSEYYEGRRHAEPATRIYTI